MKLKKIIKELKAENLFVDANTDDIDSMSITGKICTDTKVVQKNDIFVCIKGFNFDGHSFAQKAFEIGASLLIVEVFQPEKIPQIAVTDSRKATAIIARLFFDDPSSKFTLIGVTGTNGKTTTTHLIDQLLKKNNIKTGLIGTLGYKIGDNFYPSERTTPDIIELNEIFDKMVKNNCKIVIMEVSSHALALHRVFGLKFNIAIFTNLTQDHLDFHKTMENYGKAKEILFQMVEANNGTSIINMDDDFGKILSKKIVKGNMAILNYKSKATCCPDLTTECWEISDFVSDEEKTKIENELYNAIDYIEANYFTEKSIKEREFTFNLKGDDLSNFRYYEGINTPLIGNFNKINLALALITLKQININHVDNVIYELDDITPPPGRMQRISNNQKIEIIVDYAHTPDALKNILESIENLSDGRKICVWGCGGDRDRLKRPQMAKISLELANLTIITNDNPRSELSADIVRDIVAELNYDENYYIIRDRETAITSAILLAQNGDVVIIAGKGHEKYQEINNEKHHFDDVEMAEIALKYKAEYKAIAGKLAIPYDILNIEKLLSKPINNDLLKDDKPPFDSISTDSRITNNNALFIALKGEKYNGEDFIHEVLQKSEDNWVITGIANSESRIKNSEFRCLFAEDTLKIYGEIAKKYLKLFGATSIAITGSTGKTTTKELLHNILSEDFPTFMSIANENNLVGVPKNILLLQPKYKYIILEAGTNQLGEIELLAKIIRPDYSLIISINPSHLKGLKSIDKIYKEKLSLIKHTKKTSIIPNINKKYIDYIPHSKYLTFGKEINADFIISSVQNNEKGLIITVNDHKKNHVFHTDIHVPFYENNIALSVALCLTLGIKNETIEKGLNKSLTVKNRMEIVKKEHKTIIYDCYNANPCSMTAAVLFWSELHKEKPHFAILGDMLELGDQEILYHQEIANAIEKIKAENPLRLTIITGVGKLAQYYYPEFHFENVQELLQSNFEEKIPQHVVLLIKGSNGIKLEQLKGVL